MAVSTLVVLAILAVVATVWAGRLVVALLFFAIIIASAIRPGVDALKRRRIPRGIGVLLHYAVLLGLVAGALWLVVPAAIDQVQSALGPEHGLREEAQSSTGIKHDLLIALDRRLNDLPSGSKLLDPALEYGRTAFEVLIGAFFVFATAAVPGPSSVSVRSISRVPSCRDQSARRCATRGSSSIFGWVHSYAVRACWLRSWRRSFRWLLGDRPSLTGFSSGCSPESSRSCP